MIRQIKIYLIPLAILLSSCGGGELSDKDADRAKLDEFRSYPINMEAPKRKFSDMISQLRIVGMEETEASLLGILYNVMVTKDKILVPGSEGKIIRYFSLDGNYLGQLNRAGEGPEEYKSLRSFWLANESIHLYDNQNKAIKSYSLDGEFLDSRELPYPAEHIYPTENGFWLDMGYRFRQGQLDSSNYRIIHLSESLEEPEFFAPFTEALGFPITTNINSFRMVDGLLSYKQTLSDTIFQVQRDTVKPWIKFDFGDDLLWADDEMRTNGQKAMAAINEAGKVWVMNSWVGGGKIYFNFNTSFQDFKQMMLDRHSGDQIEIDVSKSTEEDYTLMWNGWVNENEMLIAINSLDLAQLLGELDSSQYAFNEGSTLEEIESSENPALMWVTFKDD